MNNGDLKYLHYSYFFHHTTLTKTNNIHILSLTKIPTIAHLQKKIENIYIIRYFMVIIKNYD